MNKEIEISPRQIASAINNLLNEKEKLEQENQQLHNKIDKAIEYIENNTYSSVSNMKTTLYLQNDELYDLLEILKDSDVDE